MLSSKTPFEALYKRPPTFHHLKVSEGKCYATVVYPKQKFEPRAIPRVFIRYPCGHKGFKLYDMQSHKFFIDRDVKFCEDVFLFHQLHKLWHKLLRLSFYHFMIHPTQTFILILSHLLFRHLLHLLFLLQIHPRILILSHLIHQLHSNILLVPNSLKLGIMIMMSYEANYLTSSSNPNTDTKYPFHHYLSFSRFSPTQRGFLALITTRHNLKPMMRQLTTHYGNNLWRLKLQLWNVIILGLLFIYHLTIKLLAIVECTRLNTTLMILLNVIKLGW